MYDNHMIMSCTYVHHLHTTYFTDTSLTLKNISNVTASVELDYEELGGWVFDLSVSKREEVYQQSSSATEEREKLIHYFLNYSQYASWSDLASKLYHREHHEALSAAKKFIKKTFGKCMCVYSNT